MDVTVLMLSRIQFAATVSFHIIFPAFIFPLTYATLLSAFYLPLIVMLCALIFRGVAFEFREKSERTRAF